MSSRDLRSYQDEYRLMTVHTHGDLIVLPLWETWPPAPWQDIPLSPIILIISQPVLAISLKMLSAWLGSDKYQFISLVWFDSTRVRTIHTTTRYSPSYSNAELMHWLLLVTPNTVVLTSINFGLTQSGFEPATSYPRVIVVTGAQFSWTQSPG